MKLHQLAAVLFCGILLPAGMQGLPAGAISLRTQEHIRTGAAETEELPAAYDLRADGLVTHVQRQGSYGMCWSFASLASLESTLVARQPDVDFSEWNLAYYTYSSVFGFPMGKEDADPADAFRQGGNYYVLAPILTSWLGPVEEARFPFGDMDVLDPGLTAEELRAQAAYHVTDMDMLYYDMDAPVTEDIRTAVKQAVYGGQAVSLSFYQHTSAYNAADCAFYNAENKREGGNYHAVCVVGWDDSYPASHFLTDPGMDGAFLCKNSWGTTWGDNGYFWMSYAEPTVAELFTVRGEDAQIHDRQYLHDRYGFWTALSIESADTTDYMANVFTAQEDTWLTSVMFATALPEEQYSVHVYENVREGGAPTSGTSSGRTHGTAAHPGYHTVTLDEPVYLTAGERFAVSVHLTGTAGQHITCEAYTRFTTELPDGTVNENESLVPESVIAQSIQPGESWYSADGRSWHDIYEEDVTDETFTDDSGNTQTVYGRVGHICVRALTQSPGRVVFSDYAEVVPAGTQIALTCPGADEIWYSYDGETWGLYSTPVPVTQETDLSAYAVINGVRSDAVTQHYKLRAAQLSSLLNCGTGEYLAFEPLTDTCFTAQCSAGTGTLTLFPITTAQLTSQEGTFSSGTATELTPGNAVTLTASEAGMQESTYVIYLTDVIRGNVNLDDAVNASDAADVLIYAAAVGAGDRPAHDAAWLDRADCDENKTVNAADAAWILQTAAANGAN